MSILREIKSALGANSHRHLLVHLGSSLVHLAISLILTFYWKEADVRSCPSIRPSIVGVALMFGALTIAYSIISAVKFVMAIGHFCFAPRSQRTITLTILATSGASACIACVGIVVIGLLSVGVGSDCFDKIPHLSTFIAFGVSIALNAVLFSAALLDWRMQQIRKEISAVLPSDDDITVPSVFVPSSTVVLTVSTASPVPVTLYPSSQISRMSSFDNLSDLGTK